MFDKVSFIDGMIKKTSTALDAIKTMLEMKETVAVNEKAIALQKELLSLQQDLFSFHTSYISIQNELTAAQARIRALENEKAEEQQLRHELERYQRHKLPSGSFVYRHKETVEGYDPDMYFCPKCHQHSGPAVLQVIPPKNWHAYLQCPQCGSEYMNERIIDTPNRRIPKREGGF